MNWTRISARPVAAEPDLVFVGGAGPRGPMLISVDRDSPISLQEQIFSRIREQIIAGILRPGSPVPSSRLLATQLRVSRNSVIFGYERLINAGYLVAMPMIRTFVAEV